MLAAAMTTRTLTIGQGTYPLVLPSMRDPRLHVAAVIITVHVLGQVGLGFWVSVPQILAAILTCWVIEVAITFRQAKAFVWPASAMLTGSGVALILRVVGTPPGQPWSFHAVEVFAVVAGLSLLSKYVIKYRGSHVFNPSNVGLVIAFVVLGSTRVEPLDFWWAPLTNPAMLLAYAVIIVGGLLITRRLKLLGLAASFWLALAVGVGVLSASGHCINTRWSFAPVCGTDFFRTIVISPEVLVFLFFMITDPKTVPAGQVGRVVFGVLVAVVSTLLMAPQTDEFWTKVGLLAGLVILSAARPIVERFVPEPKAEADDLRRFGRRLLNGGNTAAGAATRGLRAGTAAVVVLALGAGIVAAGTPARGFVIADSSEVLNRLPQQVDPATLPTISVGQDVVDFDPLLAGPGMQEVVVTLAQNLELENQALLARDPELLAAVDHGDRLAEMRARLEADPGSINVVTLEHYRFESIDARLLVPFGVQDGFSIGLDATGTLVRETYSGETLLLSEEVHFANTFALRRATGSRWLTIGVLPLGGAGS
jgi:Na+-translocating ferredoxin:NAD+ oxidoreductase RnfD subunit